jgi:hypothetical protein
MSYADYTTHKLGETKVKVRRLTLGEVRENYSYFAAKGAMVDDDALKLIERNVTTMDGGKIAVDDLSLSQLRDLMLKMVGIPEESPLSDFIGLLS